MNAAQRFIRWVAVGIKKDIQAIEDFLSPQAYNWELSSPIGYDDLYLALTVPAPADWGSGEDEGGNSGTPL